VKMQGYKVLKLLHIFKGLIKGNDFKEFHNIF